MSWILKIIIGLALIVYAFVFAFMVDSWERHDREEKKAEKREAERC